VTPDLAALAVAHPTVDLAGARVVDNGWDFVVVDTGEWVFRLPRREPVAMALRVERRLLAMLGRWLPVRVPDLSLHTLPDGTPYGMYPRLPGVSATCADAVGIAPDVADLLTALHAVDAADGVIVGLAAPGKLDLDVLAGRATTEVVPLLPWESVAALHEAFATLREPVPVEVVVHADLGASNLLVEGGRLAGVIDWTDTHIGDAAQDLSWWVQCLGADRAREVLAGYVPPRGVDHDVLWRRAVAHATVQPVHAVLFGMDSGRPAYVARQLARLVPGGRA
jgi:aminoglycoside phosphotransferase (APT) family kinase protein